MMRPEHGIATDGAHSMKRGVTRYRAVDLATGELLFEQNIGNQTINIGEFLGVVEAAKYIIEHRFSPPNLGRQAYRDTRQTRQSTIRRLTPNNRFTSKTNRSVQHQKPSKTTFFRGLFPSMYLLMSSILLSLLSESENPYKNLIINALY